MDMTLFESSFGYPMYGYDKHEAEYQEHIKADEKTRQLLASKGIALSSDLENDVYFVSLLFMIISVWEMDNIDSFICEPFIKAFYKDMTQSDGITYPVTIELQNGYDMSFGVTGEKYEYNFEVFIHGGVRVTDAPIFNMLLDSAVPLEDYLPYVIAELPSDAHFQTEFETYLRNDYDTALDAYGVYSYEEVDQKVCNERKALMQKYSAN